MDCVRWNLLCVCAPFISPEAAGEHFSPCPASDDSSWSFFITTLLSLPLFFASVKISPSQCVFLCWSVFICNTLRATSCALPLQKDRGEPLGSTCERKSFWCNHGGWHVILRFLEKGFLIPRNCSPKIIKAVTRWQTLTDTCKDPCKILKLSLAGECTRTEIPRLPLPLSECFAPHAELITPTYWISSTPFCRN